MHFKHVITEETSAKIGRILVKEFHIEDLENLMSLTKKEGVSIIDLSLNDLTRESAVRIDEECKKSGFSVYFNIKNEMDVVYHLAPKEYVANRELGHIAYETHGVIVYPVVPTILAKHIISTTIKRGNLAAISEISKDPHLTLDDVLDAKKAIDTAKFHIPESSNLDLYERAVDNIAIVYARFKSAEHALKSLGTFDDRATEVGDTEGRATEKAVDLAGLLGEDLHTAGAIDLAGVVPGAELYDAV